MIRDFSNEESVRELRDTVATLEIPPLASDAFARIVARRSSGERIELRTVDVPNKLLPGSATTYAIAAAAVAATIVMSFIVLRDSGSDSGNSATAVALAAVDSACASAPATTADSSTMRHLMISTFGIPAACGAEPGQDPPIDYRPSQIASGTFTYTGRTITDGVFTSTNHQPSVVFISRTIWKGKAAIAAVREGALLTGIHLDSLIVSADGPTPLYFASIYTTQHPPGTIRAVFDSSSITIAMSRLDTTAHFAFRMKSGQLPFGFASALDIPALPLALGWRGTIEVAPPIHPRAYKLFLRPWETIALRVVGRERVRVAAGTFDCWKLQVGEPAGDSFIWVDTDNHLVVRSVSISRIGDTSFEDQQELSRADFGTK